MGTFVVLLSSFLIFMISPPSIMATTEDKCSNSRCSKKSPLIQFPFRLYGRQHESCGHRGFDLLCSSSDKTVLNLGSSGDFLVRHIDYVSQVITIFDQDNCIPKRLLKLNLTDTPFKSVPYKDFWLLKCSTEAPAPTQFGPISCLSSSNYSVFATSSSRIAKFMVPICESIGTVSVPIPWQSMEFSITSDLNRDLLLTWGEPYCGECVERGGKCGFQSNTSTDIGCFHIPRRGLPRSIRYVITIGVGIPALMCAIGIACFVCARVKKSYGWRHQAQGESSSTVMPQPATIVMVGLDERTIESYPKVVLGESRRLPKPDDNTCSICLSEYKPKETLKTIPECKHIFHADCIDEWLRMNATCPICRNSPNATQPPVHTT